MPRAAFAADAAARTRIEQLAMNAVRRAEEARGCRVVDVSAEKCGWDLTSYPPAVDGKLPEPRHIEVKGRVKGASTVTVTKNEIFESWNQGVKDFVLGHRDRGRAFDAALDLDVAGLGLFALHGGRIGGEVPAAFLGRDIDHAAAAGFLGPAHGVHGELLDARAGGGIGGKGGAGLGGLVHRAGGGAIQPERPARHRGPRAWRR